MVGISAIRRSRCDRFARKPVRRAPPTTITWNWPDREGLVPDYFSEQDAIIAEIEEDLRGWLLGLTYTVSGQGMIAGHRGRGGRRRRSGRHEPDRGDPLRAAVHGAGGATQDAFVYPDPMPEWFTEADLDFYTAEFERSGLGGPLSFYHNIDNDRHDLADQEAPR